MINTKKINFLLETEFQHLKKRCERLDKLAEIIGATNRTARNLLKGKCNSVVYLKRIADYFGLEVDELLIKKNL